MNINLIFDDIESMINCAKNRIPEVPQSREMSLVRTKLDESLHWLSDAKKEFNVKADAYWGLKGARGE